VEGREEYWIVSYGIGSYRLPSRVEEAFALHFIVTKNRRRRRREKTQK
jgi:hypothetical protein